MHLRLCYAALVFQCAALPTSGASIDAFPTGVRSLAMGGAQRAIGSSHDSIIANPAGMTGKRSYSASAHYSYAEYGKVSQASIAALDAQTTPLAAGFDYRVLTSADSSNRELYIGTLAFATDYANIISVGMSARHFGGYQQEEEVDYWSSDMGLLLNLGSNLKLGATYHNAIRTLHTELSTPVVAIGVGFDNGTLALGADARQEMVNTPHPARSLHVGAEYLVIPETPFRAGYHYSLDKTSEGALEYGHHVTCGMAYQANKGSIDLGFDISALRPEQWFVAVGLSAFF